MTDLILSAESTEYQKLARDFFQNEVAPKSEKLDHSGDFSLDLYKAAWELGLATTFIPEKQGGLGLSLWDCVVMAEEVGATSGGLTACFESNVLAAAPILIAGSEAQKDKFLGQLCNEPALASYVFPALADGSSFPTASATYRTNGNKFILNGSDAIAVNGEHAAWFFVLAQEENSSAMSAFVFPVETAGVARGAQIYKLGRRCADICRFQLKDVELSEDNLIGTAGEGRAISLESNCIASAFVAAHATGLMRNALENSVRYAQERQTFGKPIGKHQAVGFMLADMAKSVQCARLMTWKAAVLFDGGDRDHTSALVARSFAIDAAMAAATDAVQIYGGYGYSKEYPVERLMRDAKMMQMMAGSSFEIKTKIAEELLASGVTA
jgi:acyl-CoA dehydrogenase